MPQPDRRPAGAATDPSAVLGGDGPDCLSVARHVLSDEGAGADVYSPEELAGVLGTGVEAEKAADVYARDRVPDRVRTSSREGRQETGP